MTRFGAMQLRGRGAGVATVLMVVVSTAMFVPGAHAIASVPVDGLVGEYLFSQTAGSTVSNNAEGPNSVADATVVNGSDAHWTGNSLSFTGGAKTSAANWVELPDDILAGQVSATITTEVKVDASMKSSYNFLWNIGNDSTDAYFFASVRDNPRTAITTSSGGGEANARHNLSLDADRWYSLTSVIDGEAGTISFYVDGVRVGHNNTGLTPASITDQSLNTIGRAPYPDPFFKGEVSAFRVYDRALAATEVNAIAEHDAKAHAASFASAAEALVNGLGAITIDDTTTRLPDLGGSVTWESKMPSVTIGVDGVTATAVQPAAGAPQAEGFLTASATVRGTSVSKDIATVIKPVAAVTDEYGYLLVHFIEDSLGYAEKIYLDVSRGDNPEQWDPLNGGEPILASHLGTTGVRDPYVTYNPETATYYIIATDLRVFGGYSGPPGCTDWCYWSKNGSTKLNIWESKDLVTWSELRQIDMAFDASGRTIAELGMAWAPEATWVDDYYSDGRGAFIVYWSSNVYPEGDPAHDSATYSRVLWGATPDFTQGTYEFGGDFVDTGGNAIDTTLIQSGDTTYRITKDNSFGSGLYMESTVAARWWESGTPWSPIQSKIGASWAGGNPGGVEGPAVFKKHREDQWYLYVDVIPTTGYRPMVTTDLDSGWAPLASPDFYMAPSTKHGGIISLTKAQYDVVRAADATAAVAADLGEVVVPIDSAAAVLEAAMPKRAEVTLTYGRGTSELGIEWNTTGVDLGAVGSYTVTGNVRSIGGNLNSWATESGGTFVGGNESLSTTAIPVTVTVLVQAPGTTPEPTVPGSEVGTSGVNPGLPVTGFESMAIVGFAAVLLAVGAAMTRIRRRTTQS